MTITDLIGKLKKKAEDLTTGFTQNVKPVVRTAKNFVEKYPTPASYVQKKTQDYFQPTTQVRTRDVFREIPAAIPKVAKSTYSGIVNGDLGKNISRGLESFDYFKPTEKVRARDFVRELPTGIHEAGKQFAQDATRFVISAAETPKTLATGKASGRYYNTPFGRVNSFQSEAQNRVRRGDPLWKAIGNPAMDTLLGASDFASAAKPILNSAKSLSKFGKTGREVANLADDLTKPIGRTMKIRIPARTENIHPNGIFREKIGHYDPTGKTNYTRALEKPIRKTGRFLIPERTVDVPFEWKSKTMQSLSRPGLTTKDISLDARIAKKRAQAKELVNKQINNQKQGLAIAEKGFVAPNKVAIPQKKGPVFRIRKAAPKMEEFVDKKTGEITNVKTPESVPFRGDIPFHEEFSTKPRVGEVLEKNLNNRPYVRPTNTISDIYETHIVPVGEKMKESIPNPEVKKLAETAGDLLEKTPQGKNPRLEAGEPNIMNQGKWLRSIGAARTKKQFEKIGFKKGQELIDKWRMKYQPDYPAKKAEKKRFEDFVADFKSSEEEGIKRGLEFLEKNSDIPMDKGDQIIHFVDTPEQAPDDIAPYVNRLRGIFNDFHTEAKNSGLDVGFWKDYITHIWKEPPQVVAKRIRKALEKGIITADDLASPNATNTPFFKPSNSRMLKTYALGEKIGLHKKYNHPAQIVAHYVKEMEKGKAIMRNIQSLKESGAIVDGVQDGMKQLTAPGMEGLSAEPELADKLNTSFGEQEYTEALGKTLGKAATASRWLKETLMSGGIPASTFNSYGVGMTLKEIFTFSPTRAKNAITSFVTANSPSISRKFFVDHMDTTKKIKRNDIQISTMLDNGGFMDKGFWKNLLGDKGEHWQKIMNEPTFGRMLPMSQIRFFEQIEKRMLKRGYSPKAAEKIAATELRGAHGLGSAAKAQATPQWKKDLLETAFFAPTHRANMMRVFYNAAKSLGNPLAPGNREAAKFLFGGMALYGMYDLVNYQNTGRHLYENPEGKKFEAYIKVGDKGDLISVPYMPTVATMPRLGIDVGERLFKGDLGGALGRAWQGTGSILSKPLADVVMNKDYFDRPIANEEDDASKQWSDRGKYLVKSYTGHPWIKAGIDAMSGKPAGQVMVQAVEAPIRFSSEEKIASADFWDKLNKVEPIHDKFAKLAKTDPRGAEKFYNENKQAIDSYTQLNETAKMYSQLKKKGTKDEFGGIAKNLGFGFVKNAEAKTDNSESDSEMGESSKKILRRYEIERKKEELANSDKNFMDLGDVVLRKRDGNVSAVSKDSYQSELYSARMTNQKNHKDFKGWTQTAKKQFEVLNKMLNDPNADEEEEISLQNRIDALIRNYEKYSGYGGFNKGKKPKKIRIKVSAPNLPKIQTANIEAPKFRIRMSSGSSAMPKLGTTKTKSASDMMREIIKAAQMA